MTPLQEMLEDLIRDATVSTPEATTVREAISRIGYANDFESIFTLHGLITLTCVEARRVAREKAERIYGKGSVS